MWLKMPSLSSFLSETSNVHCRQRDVVTWSPICTLCSKLACNRQNKQSKCSPSDSLRPNFLQKLPFFFFW